ncbi:MAG: 5'/3'-nucleotidase SurE [Phycisphaerales bacterium]|nr:5'/3'-nucleotidase SurE [Phycisphaerales bacterium]
MRILLCNDDGITAQGIVAMHDALTDPEGLFGGPLGEVFVVAPLTVQSATGHGVTFREPLMTAQVDVNEGMSGVAVDGRPADCVKLALAELWPERFGAGSRPDLVVSGMNMGANVGINILYSGTCAAAIEAAFLGVPSVAVSLRIDGGRPRYDVAAGYARRVLERLLAGGPLAPHTCLNVNIPITESDGPMPAVAAASMNTHGMIDAFTRNKNPLGQTYFWSSGQPMEFHATEAGSDVQALAERKITVTPLKFDMTDHGRMSEVAQRLGHG